MGRRFLNGNECEKEGEEIGTVRRDRDVKNPGFERVGDGDWRMTCEEFISRRQRGGEVFQELVRRGSDIQRGLSSFFGSKKIT